MERSILVPLDGSPETEGILAEVQRIATVRDQVHFLHVVPPLSGFDPANVIFVLEQALKFLKVTRDRWLPDQQGLDLVECADPAEAILRVALEKNINLIAMTTHGRNGFGRVLFGSVAAEVVKKSQLPVLLTRPCATRSSQPLQKILIGVEGSETPRDLLETVKSLARETKAEIILFRAVAPVKDPSPQWATPSFLASGGDPEQVLQAQADALEEQGFVAWPLVVPGKAAEEILKQAEKLGVDLIALAPHAREGLERFLEGSITEQVLRASPVAVLLQKALVVHKPALQEVPHA